MSTVCNKNLQKKENLFLIRKWTEFLISVYTKQKCMNFDIGGNALSIRDYYNIKFKFKYNSTRQINKSLCRDIDLKLIQSFLFLCLTLILSLLFICLDLRKAQQILLCYTKAHFFYILLKV